MSKTWNKVQSLKIERGQWLLGLHFQEAEPVSECESSIELTADEFLLLKELDVHVIMYSRICIGLPCLL